MHPRHLFVVLVVAFVSCARAADLPPLVHEAVFNVPIQKVWEVFTTSEGFKKFGVALADVDFRLGGKIRSRYAPDGELGDAATIEQTILAYEPMRMFAYRCTKTPEGFPFPEAMKHCWNIAYFDDLGGGRTRLTLKGFGYTDDPESVKMREFFDAGNAWSMDKLHATLEGAPPPSRKAHEAAKTGDAAPGGHIIPPPIVLSTPAGESPIVVEAVVNEPLDAAWLRWTTTAGLATFFGEKQNFELRPGGPFEILFSMEAPEGQRGSEGCSVLSYETQRMLSFSWNAPPKFPAQRSERTWVVVSFAAEGAGMTRVRLVHQGWVEHIATAPAEADNWRQVRTYFTAAWPNVLAWHQEAVAKRQAVE
jgi:uncharacterized protein YndB with AHSA1/START domain